MRPITIQVTGVADSPPIPIDMYQNPTNISVGVVPGAGCTYTVQYTTDDVFAVGYVPANGNWSSVSAGNLVAAVTAQQAKVTDPATAYRLHQTAGATVTTLRLVQSGVSG